MKSFEVVDMDPCLCLVKSGTCVHDQLGETISALYGQLANDNPEATMVAPPRLYYTRWTDADCDIEAAFPVDVTTSPASGTQLKEFPGGICLTTSHHGSYDTLSQSWAELWTEAARQGLKANGAVYDIYVTDPGSTPNPAEWVTEIYIPVEVPKF